ncbi:uncharacterized protein JN550_011554 [Neoarthrinium moseri]|uniref:uncharacterized protein n=1 Tax=Neoarthrinium moseri TaxID=1658444 RepID=UPI001FDB0B93|nr:uncharacterized protein JN550_011554 [Neoarthrinium moseri]KAI1860402.1 hypothetical protein JN550_011554 [Neoarthrinium moseri]
MRFATLYLAAGSVLATEAVSYVLPRDGYNTGSVPLPSRLLHHWPNGTWVENISVRPNGNLLLTTSTPNGTVWHVKNPWDNEPEVELAYNFDEWVDRLIGIGESTPDKYVVVGSRFYSPGPFSSQVDRTFCAMELDYSADPKGAPKARLIAWFPEATLLQSVAALPWNHSTVLISDQYVIRGRYEQIDWTPSPGQIWRLDTNTGDHTIVATNYSEMNTTYHHGEDVGIDGIKILDDYLYWVNQDDGGIYKLQIDEDGVPLAPGKAELVSKVDDQLWDDFAFGPGDEKIIWATGYNSIWAVSIDNGTAMVVDGVGTSDNLTFPGPTAAQFGRTQDDCHILYVTGNLYSVPDNLLNLVMGGWVRAIDTTGFHFS